MAAAVWPAIGARGRITWQRNLQGVLAPKLYAALYGRDKAVRSIPETQQPMEQELVLQVFGVLSEDVKEAGKAY